MTVCRGIESGYSAEMGPKYITKAVARPSVYCYTFVYVDIDIRVSPCCPIKLSTEPRFTQSQKGLTLVGSREGTLLHLTKLERNTMCLLNLNALYTIRRCV